MPSEVGVKQLENQLQKKLINKRKYPSNKANFKE